MKSMDSGCCGKDSNKNQQLRIPLYAISSVEMLPSDQGNLT